MPKGLCLISNRADGFACLQFLTDGIMVAGHIIKRLGGAFFAKANLKGDTISAPGPIRPFEGKGVNDTGHFLARAQGEGKSFYGDTLGAGCRVGFTLAKNG